MLPLNPDDLVGKKVVIYLTPPHPTPLLTIEQLADRHLQDTAVLGTDDNLLICLMSEAAFDALSLHSTDLYLRRIALRQLLEFTELCILIKERQELI